MNGKPGMEQPEVRNAKQIGIFKKMIITEKREYSIYILYIDFIYISIIYIYIYICLFVLSNSVNCNFCKFLLLK